MNRRPATEALEGSARINYNRIMPPLARTVKLSSSGLKFDMTAMLNAAVSMEEKQQQDSMQFPVIAWSSDDDETEGSDELASSGTNLSSSDFSSVEEEKSNCKLTTTRGPSKRRRQDCGGAHRMIRSKALYSELSQMSPSLSAPLRSPVQRRSIASQMA
jgi:hypothetical protein